ncbi:2,3-dihydroxyphenylpropionate 1,2-dioxygenase [Pusillimonas sp.]|uniref:DODA-type extradiol aromatic ring-opening family dioxygenase n=1 Tax=Pusillimonas sp. TaxID=3040095 RepID=UPI0037C9B2CC
MAEVVGVYAASHTPVMLNFPDAIPEADRSDIFAAFTQLGQDLRAARPDVVVIISDDHVHNFFLDNLPAFCIGATDAYPTPVEHWLKAEKQVLKGHRDLGAHLLTTALQEGFDPAFSMELTLDHGVLTPLVLAGIADQVSIVPILVNCVQPPLPTMMRTLQWGRFLATALRCFPENLRIAVLATGGLSHDIATPRMGMVNEEFDRRFLGLLASGDDDALIDYATNYVDEAGNGAEEVRTWLMAHGAAQGVFEQVYYKPMPGWYTGIGLGRWSLEGRP